MKRYKFYIEKVPFSRIGLFRRQYLCRIGTNDMGGSDYLEGVIYGFWVHRLQIGLILKGRRWEHKTPIVQGWWGKKIRKGGDIIESLYFFASRN